MSSSSTATPKPPRDVVRKACGALGRRLGQSTSYAVLGGAACQLLGSTRLTEDVDFVVPKGEVKIARGLLKADTENFTMDPRTLHTYYKGVQPVEIEIISPPGTFKEDFDAATPIYIVEAEGFSVKVLHPILLLNAKCRSILGRASGEKKESDANDIKFLLRWLAANGVRPQAQQVPNASREFVQWYNSSNHLEELWKSAGFDFQTGSF